MARITVIGTTGFAGSHITREAASRGHAVTGLSRSTPADPIPNVTYVAGSVTDPSTLSEAIDGAEVVVAALSPRGELAGNLLAAIQDVAARVSTTGARLVVIGGAGSLRVAPDGPRVAEGDSMPAFLIEEARQTAASVDWLEADAPEGLDWTFVSPAFSFSPRDPGEATGSYTFAGNVAKFDSRISAPDFASAIVDEIEQHTQGGHVSVYS
jgi:putative NADH-flavin reductase